MCPDNLSPRATPVCAAAHAASRSPRSRPVEAVSCARRADPSAPPQTMVARNGRYRTERRDDGAYAAMAMSSKPAAPPRDRRCGRTKDESCARRPIFASSPARAAFPPSTTCVPRGRAPGPRRGMCRKRARVRPGRSHSSRLSRMSSAARSHPSGRPHPAGAGGAAHRQHGVLRRQRQGPLRR